MTKYVSFLEREAQNRKWVDASLPLGLLTVDVLNLNLGELEVGDFSRHPIRRFVIFFDKEPNKVCATAYTMISFLEENPQWETEVYGTEVSRLLSWLRISA